ncbi:MAG: ferrochelatase [Halobacteriovoraceae bacterium]|nr:ferrochelatase [Halobacteriovoraceae bacterium]MCB9093808.1 ferrochelatase [Halobacteriovoraceae bacterium]
MKKTKVIIAQLGSPKTPKVSDVRTYLKEFLGDPRVVDLNPTYWKIILNLFVLPFRPKKSAQAYSRIWDGSGFPLITITEKFVDKLKNHFKNREDIEFNTCFLLSDPRPKDILAQWESEPVETRAERVLLLPQFPQYSESTIASVYDCLAKDIKEAVNIPNIKFVSHFHRLKAFIDSYVKNINEAVRENNPDELIVSFHGIPLRRVIQKKDVYYRHCFETYLLLKERIVGLSDGKIHLTFQSRFGSEQWLGPATDSYAEGLARAGAKKIAVVCPSFTVDCLETIDEIGHELGEDLRPLGCEIIAISCLNDQDEWVEGYAKAIDVMINSNLKEKNELSYEIDEKMVTEKIPEQEQQSPPLSKEMKGTLKIVFFSIFLDLVGFSIIFPLFPALSKYYLQVDPDNFFLKLIWGSVEYLGGVSATEGSFRAVVLFGGILGALYSLLQFVSSPFWGSLSDRIGRKPVMLTTIFGLFISYIIWIFSGSFSLLILARFIGGLMGGNLSAATAVVADITDEKRRSKGMAFIGIAFAFGFIFGPAIGGILSLIDLTKMAPALESYGINPFSVPAIFSAILCLINLWMIKKSFQETLPAEKRGKVHTTTRSANLLKLFHPVSYKGVNQTNWANFLFTLAFSGMEFTLTFLAVERLGFSSMDNGMMFIFIGFFIALTQGGYVRRKAHQVGEKKMARQGLILLIPGLLLICYTQSVGLLYGGLFFLSIGSAMVIPCLTSLVSLYTPSSEQGKVLGIFRSLGSLGRVAGPIVASLIYWNYGSQYPYLVGISILIIPIVLISLLPQIDS